MDQGILKFHNSDPDHRMGVLDPYPRVVRTPSANYRKFAAEFKFASSAL